MFMHDLNVIARFYRVFCERSLTKSGYEIGLAEQNALSLIEAYGETNQDSVGRHLLVDKGSITKTLAKLEAKGLIKRWENPQNRRENLLALAPASEPVLKQIKSLNQTWEILVTQGLDPTQLHSADGVITGLLQNALKAVEHLHET